MTQTTAPLPRLTRAQFWGAFAVLLAIFLFAHGPIWRNAWRPDQFDSAVLWSYAPIPVLVLAGLVYKKRLSWRAFVLDTLELTLLKYSATFLFAMGLWATTPRPPKEAYDGRTRSTLPTATAPRPPATPIADDARGAIEGVVRDASGGVRAGAIVYVASGLERFVFDPDTTPIEVTNGGEGFVPRVTAVQSGQPFLARSTDGKLHTFVARQGDAALFNTPVLGTGARESIDLRDASGLIDVTCSVHAHLGTERPSRVRVLAHPFFTRTSDDGKFRLDRVPAGAVELVAETDDAKSPPARVTVPAKDRATLELRADKPL